MSWLRTVEDVDLHALGGEKNRLYQLLVEGSVAHHLELDAATLEAAASRSDLFSAKQCEQLTLRQEEAEKKVQEEAERALVTAKEQREQQAKEQAELKLLKQRQLEEEKKKRLLEARYEAERQAHLQAIRESEEMARGVVIEHPAHSLVEINNLTSKQGRSLNGTIGTIMHKKEGRYVVQCQIDGKLRSFLPANLNNLGVQSSDYASNPIDENPTSWSCDICTYLHEGDRALATKCDICNNPRDNVAPTANSMVSDDSTPAAAAAVAPAAKKQQTMAPPVPEVKRQTVAVAVKPKNAATKAKSPDRKGNGPCFHGSNCRFLKRGEECKFYHSPEEIEQAKAEQKLGGKVDAEIYIPDVTVGWVIGTHGAHMKDIQRKSKAKVSIDQKTWYPNKMRIVRMHGSGQSISMAVKMITELVEKFDDGRHGHKLTVMTSPPGTKSPTPTKSPPPTKSPTPIKSPVSNGPISPAASRASKSPTPPPQIQQQPMALPKAAAQPTPISPPRSAFISPSIAAPVRTVPAPIQRPSGVSVPTINTTQERLVTPSPRPSSPKLHAFLQEHKGCIKGSPDAFYEWLATEDIVSLEDLAAAVSDDDYIQRYLQPGDGTVGVKGFKRAAFKKAVLSAFEQNQNGSSAPAMNGGHANEDEAPSELICPISHVLMSHDPVIAADGHTVSFVACLLDCFKRRCSNSY